MAESLARFSLRGGWERHVAVAWRALVGLFWSDVCEASRTKLLLLRISRHGRLGVSCGKVMLGDVSRRPVLKE